MAVATAIRVERSRDRSHDHIVGVWTSDGTYRTNRQVADSMKQGEQWFSSAGGLPVPISAIPWCPGMNCGESPYLVSRGFLQKNVRGGIKKFIVPHTHDALEMLPGAGPRPIGYVFPVAEEQAV